MTDETTPIEFWLTLNKLDESAATYVYTGMGEDSEAVFVGIEREIFDKQGQPNYVSLRIPVGNRPKAVGVYPVDVPDYLDRWSANVLKRPHTYSNGEVNAANFIRAVVDGTLVPSPQGNR